VNICVAVLATLSDVSEDGFDVTLCARNGLMHSAQWVTCLVVIKFGDSADRLPRTRGVAVLAWDGEASVGTVSCPAGNLRPRRCRTYGNSNQAHC
jgi:hypothetical protein